MLKKLKKQKIIKFYSPQILGAIFLSVELMKGYVFMKIKNISLIVLFSIANLTSVQPTIEQVRDKSCFTDAQVEKHYRHFNLNIKSKDRMGEAISIDGFNILLRSLNSLALSNNSDKFNEYVKILDRLFGLDWQDFYK